MHRLVRAYERRLLQDIQPMYYASGSDDSDDDDHPHSHTNASDAQVDEVMTSTQFEQRQQTSSRGMPRTIFTQRLVKRTSQAIFGSLLDSPTQFAKNNDSDVKEAVDAGLKLRMHHVRRWISSVKSAPHHIVLVCRPILRTQCRLRLVLDCHRRVQKLWPLVREILLRTRATEVVFAGTLSGGSIASLLAWRCFELFQTDTIALRHVNVVTVDEVPVYTLTARRRHPVLRCRYLAFLSQKTANDPQAHFGTSANRQAIQLAGSEPQELVDSLTLSVSEGDFDVQNWRSQPLTDVGYVNSREQGVVEQFLRRAYLSHLRLVRTFEAHNRQFFFRRQWAVAAKLANKWNRRIGGSDGKPHSNQWQVVTCAPVDIASTHFRVDCQYQARKEEGPRVPLVQYFVRLNVRHEREISQALRGRYCQWLMRKRPRYRDAEARATLQTDDRLRRCLSHLLRPSTSAFPSQSRLRDLMPWFLKGPHHCHYVSTPHQYTSDYDANDNDDQDEDSATGPNGAMVLPLGSLELLVTLVESNARVFYDVFFGSMATAPSACRQALEPVAAAPTKLQTTIRQLAGGFVLEKTQSQLAVEHALFGTHSTPRYQQLVLETNALPGNAVGIPEQCAPSLATCLSAATSMPLLDCTHRANHLLGYCPPSCDPTTSKAFSALCREVLYCRAAGMWVHVAARPSLWWDLSRPLSQLKRKLDLPADPTQSSRRPLLYALYTIRLRGAGYAMFGRQRDFYLVLQEAAH